MSPSKIEWTTETWNPTLGCSRVSPGCTRCYAIRVAHRGMAPAHQGLTVSRPGEAPDWTGEVRLLPERLATPLRYVGGPAVRRPTGTVTLWIAPEAVREGLTGVCGAPGCGAPQPQEAVSMPSDLAEARCRVEAAKAHLQHALRRECEWDTACMAAVLVIDSALLFLPAQEDA